MPPSPSPPELLPVEPLLEAPWVEPPLVVPLLDPPLLEPLVAVALPLLLELLVAPLLLELLVAPPLLELLLALPPLDPLLDPPASCGAVASPDPASGPPSLAPWQLPAPPSHVSMLVSLSNDAPSNATTMTLLP